MVQVQMHSFETGLAIGSFGLAAVPKVDEYIRFNGEDYVVRHVLYRAGSETVEIAAVVPEMQVA